MTVLLIAFAVVALLVWLNRLDRRRCRRINSTYVDLSVASRAKSLADCPVSFLNRLQDVLDGDQP